MSNAPMVEVFHQVRRLAAAQHDRAAPDRELLERFISGRDEDAFSTLLRRHGPMVLGVCRRELRHAQDAEDAFQATFLILARKAASIRKRDALASWLHGVAVRAARNLRRGALRRAAREAPAADVPQPDAVAELTWREVQVALDEELERLPERFRAPLVLCCLEGRSRDEAARQLGWSPGALKGRLERGRELLRARLTRRGVALSAALVAATLAPGALAAVPGPLALSALQAAKLVAAGKVVSAGLVSAPALSLAEATAKGVWLTNVKATLLLILALGLAGAGAGWVAPGGKEAETRAGGPSPAPRLAGRADEAPGGEGPVAARPAHILAAPPRGEVSLRPLASWRLHTTLKGPGSPLHAVAFSPDGKTVAAGTEDGRVGAWDLGSGDESFTLPGTPGGRVRSLVFAPDGGTLASGRADGSVTVWDVGRRAPARDAARGLAPGVQTLLFGPGEAGLLWSRDDGAVEGEVRDGKPRPLLSGNQATAGRHSPVRCTAVSPDGRTAARGMEDGSVGLWDTKSRTEKGSYRVHAHQVWCVAFSPDGRVVASVDHFGVAKAWDAGAGRELATSRHGGGGHVQALAFSPDGTVVATGTGYCDVRLWEIKTGKERTFYGHRGAVGCVAFSRDGRFLASASTDGTVKVWAPVPAPGEGAAEGPGG
jgi:RNA polymerase sigma factor (sigma-70 family)